MVLTLVHTLTENYSKHRCKICLFSLDVKKVDIIFSDNHNKKFCVVALIYINQSERIWRNK